MIREQDAPPRPTRPAADRPDERRRLANALEKVSEECERLVNTLHRAEAATLRGLKRWEKAKRQYKRAERRRHALSEQLRDLKGGKR